MALDIRGLGNQEALSQIAKLAYGSGTFEGTSGGKGNIGLLDGRVVKFNTHWSERGGETSRAMRADCDALRTKLSEIATSMLSASPDATPQTRRSFEKALADVRKMLEMDAAGRPAATTKLLDRKVVAKVINTIDKATGFDAWSELRTDGAAARALSSKGVDTTFGSVRGGFDLASIARDAAASLRHPADGKPGVTLNETATEFLTGLIDRDVAARRAAGKPAPTRDEIDRGIRDFKSPYLAVTLQTFNLDSKVLTKSRPSLKAGVETLVFLSGSPRQERADRADVALSLLSDANPAYRSAEGVLAMALVSEKMPEMRRIQPDGRLTGETVWQACFGESAPRGVAGEFGSRAFSDAFISRLLRLGDDLLAQYGGNKFAPRETLSTEPGYFVQNAAAGMGFTASVRLASQDSMSRLNAARDFVAAPPLYNVQDALVVTDASLMAQLKKDTRRDIPIVCLHDGQDVETFDFAGALEDVMRQTQGQSDSMQQMERERRLGEKVDAFVTAFDARYGSRMTEAQRKVTLFGLTQAACFPFCATQQLMISEHSKMTIDIRREDDGAFVISYVTDRDRADDIDVRYSYRVEPDGANYRGDEFTFDVAIN